jgi:hypothetical protein
MLCVGSEVLEIDAIIEYHVLLDFITLESKLPEYAVVRVEFAIILNHF